MVLGQAILCIPSDQAHIVVKFPAKGSGFLVRFLDLRICVFHEVNILRRIVRYRGSTERGCDP